MTEENQPLGEKQSLEQWLKPPEELIGKELSLWHDERGGPRYGPTQTFEEHPEVSEGVLALYPWRSVVSMKVGEPDARRTRRRTGLLWRAGRGEQQSPRDGSVAFRLEEED